MPTVRARLRPTADPLAEVQIADIDIFADNGQLAAQIRGLTLRAAPRESIVTTTSGFAAGSVLQKHLEAEQHRSSD